MSDPRSLARRLFLGGLAAGLALASLGFALLSGSTPPLPGPARPAKPVEVDRFLSGWALRDNEDLDAASGFPLHVKRKADGMRMRLIPAGSFWMGSPEKTHWQGTQDAYPRHAVTLTRAYYLDETEVTVGMYRRFAATSGRRVPTLHDISKDGREGDHPISDLDFGDALAYLAWAHVGLPTEAQWERAARGGREGGIFPWGDEDDVTKRGGLDELVIRPVKSFPPNEYGLYDMAGNVSEWCADGYDPAWYAKSPSVDPLAPPSDLRVVRGGSYGSSYPKFRCSARDAWGPGGFKVDAPFTQKDLDALMPDAGGAGTVTVTTPNVGFRAARTLP